MVTLKATAHKQTHYNDFRAGQVIDYQQQRWIIHELYGETTDTPTKARMCAPCFGSLPSLEGLKLMMVALLFSFTGTAYSPDIFAKILGYGKCNASGVA